MNTFTYFPTTRPLAAPSAGAANVAAAVPSSAAEKSIAVPAAAATPFRRRQQRIQPSFTPFIIAAQQWLQYS